MHKLTLIGVASEASKVSEETPTTPPPPSGLLVIAEGEEFLLENLYFPGVLDVYFPPRQVDARGSGDACSIADACSS